MANHPAKPASPPPKPPPPKPPSAPPPKPSAPPPAKPGDQKPGDPGATQKPGDPTSSEPPHGDHAHDDPRHAPGAPEPVRDERTNKNIPGTPTTPPEGHDYAEPGPQGPISEPEDTRTPPPARTIADEQRARSSDLERQGVEKSKEANDERTGLEPRQVPGVSPTAGVDPDEPGATRSTQAAREAQHRAAP